MLLLAYKRVIVMAAYLKLDLKLVCEIVVVSGLNIRVYSKLNKALEIPKFKLKFKTL